ncbi:MAG: hypothetical protein LC770_05920 [Acidobacteria bacterium]|nr:hypothetical protein [Acidobacteriota bacterium]
MNKNGRPHYLYWAIVSLLLLTGSFGFRRSADAHRIALPANKVNATVARGKPPNQYARLIGKLRAQRASVKSTKEKVWQPFFSVSGRIMKVNNEAIQVFEYSNAATTQSQAKRVSPDGKTIGNSKPSWMSTPHFFKSQKLIVIYVGDDQLILRILQAELGNQFAGG